PVCSQLSMTSLAAAAFQHDLALEKLGSNRRDPTQELISVKVVALHEVLPLPAKILSGGCFVSLNSFRHSKPGYAANDRKTARARIASEFTLHDLGALGMCDR